MKSRLFLIGLLFFIMAGFVGAVSWNESAYSGVTYNATEDAFYYHNFSINITGFANDITFAIDTQNNISWTNASGTYNVSAGDVSAWILMTNSSIGELTINASYDNQTGVFVIPIQATNTSDNPATSTGAGFTFNITSVNDAPNFTTLDSNYTFDESLTPYIFDINATDEEGENSGMGYPLNWSVNVTSCDYSDSSTRTDNVGCNDLLLSKSSVGNTTYRLNFTATNEFVGNYTLLLKVNDSNSQTEQNVTFTIANVNDAPNITFACDTDRSKVEDEIMSCWVNATDIDEENNLTFTIFSNLAQFTFNDSATSFVYNCSQSGGQCNASANVTFILNDSSVGNWSVNISVVDTASSNTVGWSNFSFFVNNTEDNVSIENVSDITVYEDTTFTITGYDDDFLVPVSQASVKQEELTFTSNNTNLVYFNDATPSADSGTNHSTATAYINYTYANENGITNASIKINVTDRLGNSLTEYYSSAETEFSINFSSDSAPEWNASLNDTPSLSLAEDTLFTYNVTMNVSDADAGDTITFYYVNVSAEFCSLNSTTFNSTSGIINFTPTDCDVGYHNITITASDGKLNSSKQFNFTVANIADTPAINDLYRSNNSTTISNGSTTLASEGNETTFILEIDDRDFLIPSGQKDAFYNESMTINVTATNSSGIAVDLFNFSFNQTGIYDYRKVYSATFTPSSSQVDNYTIFVNITDNSGISINRTFFLNISEVLNPPNLTAISNKSVTIYDYLNFTANAIDDEDDNLSYSILNVSVGAPNLTIGNETGIVEFNMSSNASYAGTWEYNITVTDSDNQTDSQTFYLFVYGKPALVSPSNGADFNLTENRTGVLNFTINHSVADNLTYEFWVDSITCSYQNSSNCSYGNLSLRETTSSFGNGTAYNWSFTPNFTDESYGNYKNLTIRIYPNTTALNSSQREAVATNFTFKLNITHTNAPVTAYNSFGPSSGTYGSSSPITLNLADNFRDYDYTDSYYQQNVTFTISTNASSSIIRAEAYSSENRLPWNGTVDGWSLQLYGEESGAEQINITANDSLTSVTTASFLVTFTAPATTTTPSSGGGGGGGKTKLKYFSLKLILPQDVVISNNDYIDIPFTIKNDGQVDLRGINLASYVRFNDEFSDGVKISLDGDYIKELKFGQAENFIMRIFANTQREGKYRATIFANVTSPKFSDWGEFFIELRKTNETEFEQSLVFVKKLIAENPECLELTELVKEAKKAFDLGEYSHSLTLSQKAINACEKKIASNEQIGYPFSELISRNVYYVSVSALVMFVLAFVFYFYKRVRFNKYRVDEYI